MIEVRTHEPNGEAGAALISAIVVIVPMLVMASASVSLLTGRSSGLLARAAEIRAFYAAEAAVDEARYRIHAGLLVSGQPFERDLGDGMKYSVDPVRLNTDGVDNDGDTLVDEADENIFAIVVTGMFARKKKRLSLHISPAAQLPLESAVTTVGDGEKFSLDHNGKISGLDTRLDGSAGDPSKNVSAVSVRAPNTAKNVVDDTNASGDSSIAGTGGHPDIVDAMGSTDLIDMTNKLKVKATTLSQDHLKDAVLGALISPRIFYHDRNLKLEDGSGCGVLIVDGQVELTRDHVWTGLIVCEAFKSHNSSRVFGAVILKSGRCEVKEDSAISWSTEALGIIEWSAGGLTYTGTGGSDFDLMAWQELSRG